MPEVKEMSFGMAMMNFFGKLPGQTAGDFLKELQALTAKDKADYTAMLEGIGYKIVQR